MTEAPSLDDKLQAAADIKEEITERFNELAALAVLCSDEGSASKLASELRCSTNFVNTLANGYVKFGPDYLNAESDPVLWQLDDWLRAILKTQPRVCVAGACVNDDHEVDCRQYDQALVDDVGVPPFHDGCTCYITGGPQYWLEQARSRQLNAAQIRAEAGVKQERKPPWYDGGATVEAMGGGNLLFSPDMEIELKGRKRIQARFKEVDE